jgi:hypothetical protein
MFQYAFGQALRRRFSLDIVYNTKDFELITTHPFLLNKFQVRLPLLSECQFKRFFNPNRQTFRAHFSKEKPVKEYNEVSVHRFNPGKKQDYYFNGYWQSEDFFKEIRSELLKSFILRDKMDNPNKEILLKIKDTESVSLHVRRDDYVNNKKNLSIHGICSLDYYKKAINQIGETLEDPHFFVFSDDMAWCKEHLTIAYPHTYVDINDPNHGYLDLTLMSHCHHFVIANSSFSWWGAWLSQYDQKIVIAPDKWFVSPQLKKRFPRIIPDSWIRVS